MPPGRKSINKSAHSPDSVMSSRLLRRASSRAQLLAQSKGSRTSQNRSSSTVEIPDSDDLLDTISVNTSTSSRNARLKEVAIPLSKPKSKRLSNCNKSAASRSPSSVLDSMEDEASDYETPATSAAVTPAESVTHGTSLKANDIGRVTATDRTLELRKSQYALSRPSNNRKRLAAAMASNDFSDDETPDVKLARKLQAEEYEATEDLFPSPKRKRASQRETRRQVVDIDDSSLDDLSDIPSSDSESDDDIPISVTRHAPPKRGSNLQRRQPTQRKGRNTVKPTVPVILGSEDESELSSLPDNSLMQGIEESEFENPSESEDLATDPSAIQSAASEDEQSIRTGPVRRNPRARGGPRRRRQRPSGLDGKARERLKLERAHPSIKTMWTDLEQVPIIKPIAGEQPVGISRKLKSFQLEGVDWMIKQEQTEYKGGLLGDEMGMGKTIQAVSLIMSDFPAKHPTLVVVPPVALMQWQTEINSYTDGKLKVLVYHGPKVKLLSIKDLRKYDVIMVSYSGLESMHRKENKGWNRDGGLVKEDSALHALEYHRILLDEAHSIKSRTTGVAKACFALNGQFKWALSGTPVQNRIGEFFSLLRYLTIEPFACYFCKQCSCKQLHWARDKDHMCTHCHHTGFQHVSVFNQEILNPITQGDDPSQRKEGLRKLRLITERIMLRRMKRDHTSSMELPPKEVVIHNEFFGEEERDFSSGIMTNTARKFDTYVSQGVMLNNYANIFGLIMQMRQTANHPDLILKKHADGGQNVLICCICDEPAEEAIRSKCRHEFCRQCAKDYVRSFEGLEGRQKKNAVPDCPRCHIPLSIDFEQPDIEQDEDNVRKGSIINRIKMENWTSSTKIEMLVYDLYKLRSKKQTHKSIVFSQFTSMLQLVEWRLRRAGFNTVMLDGSMTPDQRQRSIDYFMNNVNVEVFLVSLKAGGVALNLTEASRVFIVDPWWNPAAEWQSADRCHRIGQRRPCVITRLCIEDSVESRIVLLQEKKANMINGTINNDQVAIDKLSPEDMQFLFRGS